LQNQVAAVAAKTLSLFAGAALIDYSRLPDQVPLCGGVVMAFVQVPDAVPSPVSLPVNSLPVATVPMVALKLPSLLTLPSMLNVLPVPADCPVPEMIPLPETVTLHVPLSLPAYCPDHFPAKAELFVSLSFLHDNVIATTVTSSQHTFFILFFIDIVINKKGHHTEIRATAI
jgi:hypothetical protein